MKFYIVTVYFMKTEVTLRAEQHCIEKNIIIIMSVWTSPLGAGRGVVWYLLGWALLVSLLA